MNTPASASPIVLFDAVGTLIYPSPTVAEAYAAAAAEYGVMIPLATIAERTARAIARGFEPAPGPANHLRSSHEGERGRWRGIVAEVFLDEEKEIVQAIFARLWDHFACSGNWRLFEDVGPTWNSLRESGWRIGIASNFDDRLESICRGLPPLDDAANGSQIFHSANVGYAKPARQFFETIADRLNRPCGELILIGDSPTTDLAAARNAGWQAWLIDRAGTSRDPFALRSLCELPARLGPAG